MLNIFIIWMSIVMQDEPREYVMASGDSTITLKRYVMCIYSTGPKRDQPEEVAERIQREHLAYQDSLHKEGIILVAGPFGGAGSKRGIVIYDVGVPSDAAPYVTNDPAVKAGRLEYELIEWWTKKGSVID
ncbi:MAG: hypothetical protein EHM43_00420 [Ignavibacteriae bacterium]|nr:MAG: hypothetical protein EHM43_00420 [Ignavibacteriota bacterium]